MIEPSFGDQFFLLFPWELGLGVDLRSLLKENKVCYV